MPIEELSWPLQRLGEGLAALARHSGLGSAAAEAPLLPEAVRRGGEDELQRWIVWAGERLGVETEAVQTTVPEAAALLRHAGPALLRWRANDGPRFVLLLGCRWGRLRLIGPDLRQHGCALESLRAALCARHEAGLAPEIDRLLESINLPAARRQRARQVMLAERLVDAQIDGVTLLRLGAASSFWRQLRQARLPRRLGWMLGVFGAVYALEIGGWRLIGQAALEGRLDFGWLSAWLLLLLSMVPLQLLGAWMNAQFALDAGSLIKQRLLAGALRMDIDAVRQQGTGQLLGRVMEAQALEGLALNSGLAVAVAVLELVFAGWILALGAAGAWHLSLLGGWLLLTLLLGRRYHHRLKQWTLMRLDMTHDLLERMVGHRTRLAQEQPQRRDAEQDRWLGAYLGSSQAMDRAMVPVAAGVPGGWVLLALAGLVPAFASGTAGSTGLAISMGGILFAHRAFSGISGGLAALARAAIAWGQVAPLFRAGGGVAMAQPPFISTAQLEGAAGAVAQPAALPPQPAAPAPALAPAGPLLSVGAATQGPPPLIDASGLGFRYRAAGEPVLQGVDLAIAHGDRLLVQGPSGGGKSTLAALLVGLRQPQAGLLLLAGLDRHTLGDDWHRLATEAPQFHENHVLTGTLGFNLLMGRQWPASDDDLAEATALCEELGLGELIARMPAGLAQQVGETGWQLSHGERSRIFLARALLQNAALTVLDESFAALDPHTLQLCLDCALRRSRALVVIAHP